MEIARGRPLQRSAEIAKGRTEARAELKMIASGTEDLANKTRSLGFGWHRGGVRYDTITRDSLPSSLTDAHIVYMI